MTFPMRARWRAAFFLLALAPGLVGAASVSYRVPDNPWVQAMLAMMETMGLLEPAAPGFAGSPLYGYGSNYPALRPSLIGAPGFGSSMPGISGRGLPAYAASPWRDPGTGPWSGRAGPAAYGFPAQTANPWSNNPNSGSWLGGYPQPDAYGASGLNGLWRSNQGEFLLLQPGGFAYRDAAGRNLSGRLQAYGDRLVVELHDGAVVAMPFRRQGPNLRLLDPQGMVRDFHRIRQ